MYYICDNCRTISEAEMMPAVCPVCQAAETRVRGFCGGEVFLAGTKPAVRPATDSEMREYHRLMECIDSFGRQSSDAAYGNGEITGYVNPQMLKEAEEERKAEDERIRESAEGPTVLFSAYHMELLLSVYDAYQFLVMLAGQIARIDEGTGVLGQIGTIEQILRTISPIYDEDEDVGADSLFWTALDRLQSGRNGWSLSERAQILMGERGHNRSLY